MSEPSCLPSPYSQTSRSEVCGCACGRRLILYLSPTWQVPGPGPSRSLPSVPLLFSSFREGSQSDISSLDSDTSCSSQVHAWDRHSGDSQASWMWQNVDSYSCFCPISPESFTPHPLIWQMVPLSIWTLMATWVSSLAPPSPLHPPHILQNLITFLSLIICPVCHSSCCPRGPSQCHPHPGYCHSLFMDLPLAFLPPSKTYL